MNATASKTNAPSNMITPLTLGCSIKRDDIPITAVTIVIEIVGTFHVREEKYLKSSDALSNCSFFTSIGSATLIDESSLR